jgi:hypothetical protein
MNLESRLIRLLVGNNQTVTNGFKALEGEKFIILVGMFIATLSFGILPIRILLLNLSTNRLHAGTNEESVTLSEQQRHRNKNRSRRWKNAISYANCFSGGVFVAACLLDLFPGKKLLRTTCYVAENQKFRGFNSVVGNNRNI